ncbi:MAG: SPOR domain-containing protein [Rhodocyclaceae bacterium]|nr:SPOR domain-containing protein [Rhodocyclaceae bacterium]
MNASQAQPRECFRGVGRPNRPGRRGAAKQHGGTLLGLIFGVLVGVLLSFAVVWYLNRTPLPFVEKLAPAQNGSQGANAPAPLPGKPGDKPMGGEKRFEFYDILEGKKSAQPLPEPPSTPAAPKETTETEPKRVHLQVGAFQKAQEAENLKARLALVGIEAQIAAADVPGKGTVYRVRIGPFATLEEMNRVRKELSEQGIAANLVKQE